MSPSTITSDEMAGLPIFNGMSRTGLEQLAEITQVETFEKDDVIIDQGKSGQTLWVLLEGNCQVVKLRAPGASHTVELAELGPQDHFGEMSFFHAAPHSATVRATTAVRVLRIDRADFDRLIDQGCAAAFHLALNSVEELADRLRRMDDWVTELVCNMNDGQQTQHEWTRFRDKLFSHAVL